VGDERRADPAFNTDVHEFDLADHIEAIAVIQDEEAISAPGGPHDALKIAGLTISSAACSNSVAQISSWTPERPRISTSCAAWIRSSTASGRAPPDSTLKPTTRNACAQPEQPQRLKHSATVKTPRILMDLMPMVPPSHYAALIEGSSCAPHRLWCVLW
jgi:hypothetical protein